LPQKPAPGRTLGEYGASASDVIAEHLWLSPDAANDNQPFGGDDGINGYAPLAIASAPTGGTAQLIWVHGNHMGVPLTYTNTTGAEISPPSFTQSAFPGQMKTLPDLYYNRYRDYDPSTGRYIQADPIGLAGDPNPYAYAMNNPLRYSDPTGEVVPLAVFAGAAAWGLFDAALDYGIQRFIEGKSAGCINWTSVLISGGVGVIGGGLGGLGRIAKVGKEFSHWIPARYINSASKSYKPWLDNRMGRNFINSKLNGNYVSKSFHGASDFWRRPAGSRVADKLPAPIQQVVRVPSWVAGPASAAAIAAGEANNDR
jgi:RHS repeat-associated protein